MYTISVDPVAPISPRTLKKIKNNIYIILLIIIIYKIQLSNKERHRKRDEHRKEAKAIVPDDRVPVLILGAKDEVVEVVPHGVELHGVAEHHEERKAQTGDGHGDAVGVAVQDVGADVLPKRKVPRDAHSKVGADGNPVGGPDNNVKTTATITWPKFIKYGE